MPPIPLPSAPLHSRGAEKSNPAARSEQAKDWAAKRAEAIAKAAKLREERENAAFGMTHKDFLDRLSEAETRDQESRRQKQQQREEAGSEEGAPKVKVRRKSPIKRLKKLVASNGQAMSTMKKKRSAALLATEQAAKARAAAEKAAHEQKRREAKPSASDPARELAQHGFEPLGPIAAGAFSTILRARRAGDESGFDVAVKTFDNAKCAKSKDLGEARDRELAALRVLAAEAEGSGRRHPHIAYMLSEHEGPNTSHAVLEYCPGGSLQRHLQLLQKQKAPARGASAHSAAGSSSEGIGMPETQVARLAWQTASALEHMHLLDLVHRDIKPGNILFDNAGGANAPDMRIKLCDFGFATKCGGKMMLRKLVGTPSYIAPELTGAGKEGGYRGRPVDMWALGVVLFEALHGKPTFYGATLEQLETRIRAVSHAPFDAPISAGARALVQALLKAEPGKRLSANKILDHGWVRQHAGVHTVAVATLDRVKEVGVGLG